VDSTFHLPFSEGTGSSFGGSFLQEAKMIIAARVRMVNFFMKNSFLKIL
jgi:hypothetical protein